MSYPPRSPVLGSEPLPRRGKESVRIFGSVAEPGAGEMCGLGGPSYQAQEKVAQILTFAHTEHHGVLGNGEAHDALQTVLAVYGLGGEDRDVQEAYAAYEKQNAQILRDMGPVPFTTPEFSRTNWAAHVGNEAMYGNFVKFFTQILDPGASLKEGYAKGPNARAAAVVSEFLFENAQGHVLQRSLSYNLAPLMHIALGLEFNLDALVAQGLALACTVKEPLNAPLFPVDSWPPRPEKPRGFAGTLSNAFKSMAAAPLPPPSESFFAAALRLRQRPPVQIPVPLEKSVSQKSSPSLTSMNPYTSPPLAQGSFSDNARGKPQDLRLDFGSTRTDASQASSYKPPVRIARAGVSALTLLDRIQNDKDLAPNNAHRNDTLQQLNVRTGTRLLEWAAQWRFSTDPFEGDYRHDPTAPAGVPPWDEIVEKSEELIWVASVLLSSTSTQGKLDFAFQGLLSAVPVVLPALLHSLSPVHHPTLLKTLWRYIMLVYVSRGSPRINVAYFLTAGSRGLEESLSALSLSPSMPWLDVVRAAVSSGDPYVPRVVRALLFASRALSPARPGSFQSSLRGVDRLDGSFFLHVARAVIACIAQGPWDTSLLGYQPVSNIDSPTHLSSPSPLSSFAPPSRPRPRAAQLHLSPARLPHAPSSLDSPLYEPPSATSSQGDWLRDDSAPIRVDHDDSYFQPQTVDDDEQALMA